MAASSLCLIFSTKLRQEIGTCSNMGRKDNRPPQGLRVGDNGLLLVSALMLIPAKMQRCGFQQMQSSGSNHHL